MVKYCERCGAKNKEDARFCESCGATLPKFARAAAKESVKAEAPSAPVVQEPRARRRGVPRIGLIALVIVVAVVIIAALFLTGGVRTGGSSPESVVTEFASAVASGNFTKARELSTSTGMATYLNTTETSYNAMKAAYPNLIYKIEILSMTTVSKTDTEATFYFKDRETISNAGQYSNVYEYQGNIYLTKVGENWKISNMTLS